MNESVLYYQKEKKNFKEEEEEEKRSIRERARERFVCLFVLSGIFFSLSRVVRGRLVAFFFLLLLLRHRGDGFR